MWKNGRRWQEQRLEITKHTPLAKFSDKGISNMLFCNWGGPCLLTMIHSRGIFKHGAPLQTSTLTKIYCYFLWFLVTIVKNSSFIDMIMTPNRQLAGIPRDVLLFRDDNVLAGAAMLKVNLENAETSQSKWEQRQGGAVEVSRMMDIDMTVM